MHVYNGFGGSERSNNPRRCRLVEQMDEGRRPESSGLNWSHYIDCELVIDIRDGCSRSGNTISYGDGDEVRIPDTNGTKYVVVWVMVLGFGTSLAYKRALLMRDSANFAGTGWGTEF